MSTGTENSASHEKVYQLDWNLDHLVPDIYEDARLREFPNMPNSSTFAGTEEIILPERVEFNAVKSFIENIDYPYTNVMWPIMSKRMLKTLLSAGDFRHRKYPVVMIDNAIVDYAEDDSPIQSNMEFHNFFAVHVYEVLDIFDWEKSVYKRRVDHLSILKDVEKIVLKEPPQGFPPLFRVAITSLAHHLYVSSQARAALEATEIRGVNFMSLEDPYEVAGSLP